MLASYTGNGANQSMAKLDVNAAMIPMEEDPAIQSSNRGQMPFVSGRGAEDAAAASYALECPWLGAEADVSQGGIESKHSGAR